MDSYWTSASSRLATLRVQSGTRRSTACGSAFTEFLQNLLIQLRSDPESRSVDQIIEHRLNQGDQPGSLRFRHSSEKPGDGQAGMRCNPASTALIDEQKIGPVLDCKNNGFSLTGVQILAQLLHTRLIFGSRNRQPRLR